MRWRNISGGYLLRLEFGEEFIQTLEDFCRNEQVTAGVFHGLGGLRSAEIGFYELEQKEYRFTQRDDLVEVVSLSGNIAVDGSVKSDPVIHAHGAFGTRELATVAGHVKTLFVGGTLEIFLRTFEEPLERVHDERTGLSLLDL